MKNVYLGLAIVGAVVPYFFFIQHFQITGFGVGDFIAAAFANGAAGGASADLVISSIVFWAYLLSRRAAFSWVYVIINLTIGLSCTLPLYLYMTARREAAGAPAAVAG